MGEEKKSKRIERMKEKVELRENVAEGEEKKRGEEESEG